MNGHIAMTEHFNPAPDGTSVDHCFRQLDMDLTWALGAAKTFRERDGMSATEALSAAFGAIAGRRYHRFKTGEGGAVAEMQAMSAFWYRLSTVINLAGEAP